MALLNWILLIAVLAMVAHEQPLTSFTDNVLVFTNTTCARVVSSWGTLVTHAKWLDSRMLAMEMKIASEVPRWFNAFAMNFRPSRWLPPRLYSDLMNHVCGA